MTSKTRTLGRAAAVAGALAATFLIALLAPVPALPDSGRDVVQAEVSERLPGWTIQKLDRSWEGAYTVVTSCAGKEVSFQWVPGHGLPPEDAWLHPSNGFARDRLRQLSDHRRYLVWYAEPRRPDSLSCDEELARTGEPPVTARTSD
jgi:hypothetical protein